MDSYAIMGRRAGRSERDASALKLLVIGCNALAPAPTLRVNQSLRPEKKKCTCSKTRNTLSTSQISCRTTTLQIRPWALWCAPFSLARWEPGQCRLPGAREESENSHVRDLRIACCDNSLLGFRGQQGGSRCRHRRSCDRRHGHLLGTGHFTLYLLHFRVYFGRPQAVNVIAFSSLSFLFL